MEQLELVVKDFQSLTTSELYEILKLRVEVFVVEQKCPYHEVDGIDRDAYHVFLRDGDKIQAYLRVIPSGIVNENAAIGRVLARNKRCGLGTKVLAAGINTAKDKLNATAIYLEAQIYVRAFYEKAGFRQISEEFVEDGIPHIKMLMECKG